MKHYNLFFKNAKINDKPINEEKLVELLNNSKHGIVRIKDKSNFVDLPVNKIKFIKCTIV